MTYQLKTPPPTYGKIESENRIRYVFNKTYAMYGQSPSNLERLNFDLDGIWIDRRFLTAFELQDENGRYLISLSGGGLHILDGGLLPVTLRPTAAREGFLRVTPAADAPIGDWILDVVLQQSYIPV